MVRHRVIELILDDLLGDQVDKATLIVDVKLTLHVIKDGILSVENSFEALWDFIKGRSPQNLPTVTLFEVYKHVSLSVAHFTGLVDVSKWTNHFRSNLLGLSWVL